MTDQVTEQQTVLDDDAAFSAGFDGSAGDVAPAPEKPAEAVEPEQPETPDPWNDVPPVLKESIESINKRLGTLDQIDHRLKSAEGRVGALQQALSAGKAAAKAAGADTPTQAEITAATESSEKWNKLEEEFPDFAAAFKERLAATHREIVGRIPKLDAEKLKQEFTGSVSEMIAAAKAEARALARVDARHEGWEETVKSKEFTDWFAQQPAETQALADSDNASDAIKLLDAYAASTKKPAQTDPAKQQRQQRRLESATTPAGAAHRPSALLSDDDAFLAGFNS